MFSHFCFQKVSCFTFLLFFLGINLSSNAQSSNLLFEEVVFSPNLLSVEGQAIFQSLEEDEYIEHNYLVKMGKLEDLLQNGQVPIQFLAILYLLSLKPLNLK